MLTTCVELEFDVHEKVKDQAKNDKVKNIVLVASLTGQEIGTQIKCEYYNI